MDNIPIEEMPAEIDRLLEINEKLIEINKNKDKETEELQKELEEYKQIGIMQFNRPYAKRYLEEKKKEIPNLMYPDSETIYEEYYNLKDRINKAVEYIKSYNIDFNNCKFSEAPISIGELGKLLDILNGSDKE